ncbi:hypothetical protein THTE_0191 [Thermogutta terrifontis]|uniref:Peptidase MA-like domain-containing protein n=1 Tax=Thermogutta terrifontis TaxID=1331910 RepID=A0A286RA16_9BACT|nr:hypothetical protein [Thermogutta terrifontis]ASV72793.1 hypothetical protein THTE_0191 [Thermogutta terrifontis]
MEAQLSRLACALLVVATAAGASYPTPNFIIHCQDPQLARELGEAAEKYRKELAQLWLGRTLPDWSRPCPVTVHVGPNLGAGGATTFVFDRGEVYGWKMTIQGSRERLLDSVLPHEITHMILASHFRQPLPRWADEGAATTVEHISEREKHRRMLLEFLRTRRGIPFRHMFAMEEYPQDIMPLYAQGYTLAEFLIQQGGHRKFIQFLEDGLKDNNWDAALARHYPYQDLGRLQLSWVDWVARGFPQLAPVSMPTAPEATLVAANLGGTTSDWRAKGSSQGVVSSIYQQLAASPLEVGASAAGSPSNSGQLVAGGPGDGPRYDPYNPPLVDVSGWRPSPMVSPLSAQGVSVAPGRQSGDCGCGGTSAELQNSKPVLQNEVAYPQTAEGASKVLMEWNSPTVWR